MWEGAGDKELGREKGTEVVRVKVNPKFYRPTEVEQLLGDPRKANEKLGWKPKVLNELKSVLLINVMVFRLLLMTSSKT